MRSDTLVRWITFQPRRLFIKLRYGKRFLCGKKVKVHYTSSLHIDSHYSRIHLGDSVSIRMNCELFTFGDGCLSLGKGVFINRNCVIGAFQKVEIGDGVTVGPNVCIYDHNHGENGTGFESSPIIIKNGAWIGANVCILSGCTIGENSIVAAGSVVTKDVPDNKVLIQKKDNILKDR